MPTLEDLLTPEQIEALKAAPVTTPAPPPAVKVERKAPEPEPAIDPLKRSCQCERRHDGFRYVGDVLVHKACGSPRAGVSMLRGATVKPRVMPCAGCDTPVTVAQRDTKAPERIVVCAECAESMSRGSSITVVEPRKHHSETGGAPVGVTVTTTPKQEAPVPIDINDLTDAELGAAVRAEMTAQAEAEVKPKRDKAAKQAKVERKAAKAAKRAERKAITAVGVLPAFDVQGAHVPALDVSAVEDLNEVPPKDVRSPYNKALYRLGEPLLSTKDEPGLGAEACTYATLIEVHQRLACQVPAEPVTPAEPKAQIAAPIDLDERKIQALQDTLGVSAKKARKMLALIS